MGEARTPDKVLRILAAFSQDEEALDWALQHAEGVWGKTALRSEIFQFVESCRYTKGGGSVLRSFRAGREDM